MADYRHLTRLHIAVLTFWFSVLAGAAAAGWDGDTDGRGRLAIVIGNSHYASERYQDLANAANDAARLSESLRRLDFEVATATDLTATQFEDLFRRYEPKLANYGAVLIFYAGHGIQVRGRNYLLPVDSLDPDTVERLTERAVPLDGIMARFAARDRQTLIFLDACNDSPLGASEAADGLATVDVGENNFVAFATQPGQSTVDGKSGNSPFTRALLQNVEAPDLSISKMMIRVRKETVKLTLGRQTPWSRSSLSKPFYFSRQRTLDTQPLGTVADRTR